MQHKTESNEKNITKIISFNLNDLLNDKKKTSN